MTVSGNGQVTDIYSIGVIGNYLPRRCGIATFTGDLVEALTVEAGEARCWAVAMNDKPEGYRYPHQVRFEINQNTLANYRTAAEFLNMNQVDIVSLQHEYGIFGGPAGSHILTLLEGLRMPVVTTLHTVLVEPGPEYRTVTLRLAELSDKLVVMSHCAVDILCAVYDIPREKIVYSPHGIPDMPFVDPDNCKDRFDVAGKRVLLTFGLLSQNKGIEYVLRGLPKVVERFPDLVYIVLGATHPHVLKHEGEKYRLSLQQLVHREGLTDHVIFENRFVTITELCEYLVAADLYVTPYINEAQITSGTLAYAMGTGKAVVSTPYWYAEEMLAQGRGRLVPFKDAGATADAVIELLENDEERDLIRKRAYDFSRNARWNAVARQYLDVFRGIKRERNLRPRPSISLPRVSRARLSDGGLPDLNIDHLLRLTDHTGILQHAKYTVADRDHGYCTDDNARALIFAAQALQLVDLRKAHLDALAIRYLSFLHHAFDPETGRFRNFMNYGREWLESVGSEDAHGRALWGLGMAVSMMENSPQRPLASTLFAHGLRAVESFPSPRAIAFTIIGADAYLQVLPGDLEVRRTYKTLAERLLGQFAANESEDWPWLENLLAYGNGKLPHALLLAGRRFQRDDMVRTGLRALEWLLEVQTEDGHLTPIGNCGWYTRDGEKARFDQQPIEAHALIEAGIAAYRITEDKTWLDQAAMCFDWFLGHNDLNLPLYDARTGGCRDGLECDGVNQNQGAESTLAWLLSLVTMHRISEEQTLPQLRRAETTKVANKGRVTSK